MSTDINIDIDKLNRSFDSLSKKFTEVGDKIGIVDDKLNKIAVKQDAFNKLNTSAVTASKSILKIVQNFTQLEETERSSITATTSLLRSINNLSKSINSINPTNIKSAALATTEFATALQGLKIDKSIATTLESISNSIVKISKNNISSTIKKVVSNTKDLVDPTSTYKTSRTTSKDVSQNSTNALYKGTNTSAKIVSDTNAITSALTTQENVINALKPAYEGLVSSRNKLLASTTGLSVGSVMPTNSSSMLALYKNTIKARDEYIKINNTLRQMLPTGSKDTTSTNSILQQGSKYNQSSKPLQLGIGTSDYSKLLDAQKYSIQENVKTYTNALKALKAQSLFNKETAFTPNRKALMPPQEMTWESLPKLEGIFNNKKQEFAKSIQGVSSIKYDLDNAKAVGASTKELLSLEKKLYDAQQRTRESYNQLQQAAVNAGKIEKASLMDLLPKWDEYASKKQSIIDLTSQLNKVESISVNKKDPTSKQTGFNNNLLLAEGLKGVGSMDSLNKPLQNMADASDKLTQKTKQNVSVMIEAYDQLAAKLNSKKEAFDSLLKSPNIQSNPFGNKDTILSGYKELELMQKELKSLASEISKMSAGKDDNIFSVYSKSAIELGDRIKMTSDSAKEFKLSLSSVGNKEVMAVENLKDMHSKLYNALVLNRQEVSKNVELSNKTPSPELAQRILDGLKEELVLTRELEKVYSKLNLKRIKSTSKESNTLGIPQKSDFSEIRMSSDIKSQMSGVTESLKTMNNELGKTPSHLNSLTHGFKTFYTVLLGGTLFTLVAYGIRSLIGAYKELSIEMGRINTITRLSNTQVMEYTDSVIRLSSKYGKTAKDVANGLYEIVSATYTGAGAFKILEASMQLSISGNEDVTKTANLVARMMSAFKIPIEDVDRVTSNLQQTIERGLNDLGQLNQYLGNIAPAASRAGMSIEETTAMISTLTASSLKTSISVTGLNAVLMKLNKNKAVDDLVASLGRFRNAGEALADPSAGLLYVLSAIEKSAQGSSRAITRLGFDYRSFRAVSLLARESQGLASENKIRAEIAAIKKDLAKAGSETVINTFGGVLNKMIESFKNIGNTILLWVDSATAFKDVLSFISNTVEGISKYLSELGKNTVIKSIVSSLIKIPLMLLGLKGLVVLISYLKNYIPLLIPFFAKMFTSIALGAVASVNALTPLLAIFKAIAIAAIAVASAIKQIVLSANFSSLQNIGSSISAGFSSAIKKPVVQGIVLSTALIGGQAMSNLIDSRYEGRSADSDKKSRLGLIDGANPLVNYLNERSAGVKPQDGIKLTDALRDSKKSYEKTASELSKSVDASGVFAKVGIRAATGALIGAAIAPIVAATVGVTTTAVGTAATAGVGAPIAAGAGIAAGALASKLTILVGALGGASVGLVESLYDLSFYDKKDAERRRQFEESSKTFTESIKTLEKTNYRDIKSTYTSIDQLNKQIALLEEIKPEDMTTDIKDKIKSLRNAVKYISIKSGAPELEATKELFNEFNTQYIKLTEGIFKTVDEAVQFLPEFDLIKKHYKVGGLVDYKDAYDDRIKEIEEAVAKGDKKLADQLRSAPIRVYNPTLGAYEDLSIYQVEMAYRSGLNTFLRDINKKYIMDIQKQKVSSQTSNIVGDLMSKRGIEVIPTGVSSNFTRIRLLKDNYNLLDGALQKQVDDYYEALVRLFGPQAEGFSLKGLDKAIYGKLNDFENLIRNLSKTTTDQEAIDISGDIEKALQELHEIQITTGRDLSKEIESITKIYSEIIQIRLSYNKLQVRPGTTNLSMVWADVNKLYRQPLTDMSKNVESFLGAIPQGLSSIEFVKNALDTGSINVNGAIKKLTKSESDFLKTMFNELINLATLFEESERDLLLHLHELNLRSSSASTAYQENNLIGTNLANDLGKIDPRLANTFTTSVIPALDSSLDFLKYLEDFKNSLSSSDNDISAKIAINKAIASVNSLIQLDKLALKDLKNTYSHVDLNNRDPLKAQYEAYLTEMKKQGLATVNFATFKNIATNSANNNYTSMSNAVSATGITGQAQAGLFNSAWAVQQQAANIKHDLAKYSSMNLLPQNPVDSAYDSYRQNAIDTGAAYVDKAEFLKLTAKMYDSGKDVIDAIGMGALGKESDDSKLLLTKTIIDVQKEALSVQDTARRPYADYMERGSKEAFDTIVRTITGSQADDPSKRTANNSAKLVTLVTQLNANASANKTANTNVIFTI